MWGDAVVGFGSYHYRSASGREGDRMVTGFSPRPAKLSVYLIDGVARHAERVADLGPTTHGVSCLYIKRLDAVDLDVSREVAEASVAYVREHLDRPQAPPTASSLLPV